MEYTRGVSLGSSFNAKTIRTAKYRGKKVASLIRNTFPFHDMGLE